MVVKKPRNTSWYFISLLVGLAFTGKKLLKNLFCRNKMPTINYPEEKYDYGPRFKGNHILTLKEDGSLRCTACMLCATNCPAQCIRIETSQHNEAESEKYPISYEIDILRCVYCGYCEEACPVDAIRMGPEWQTPALNGSNFTYDIKHLAYRPQLKGGVKSIVDDKERHSSGL